MEKLKKETKLKLSKTQLQSVINNQIEEEQGLNDLFAMMINGLMLSERRTFLTDGKEGQNKGNGYRYASRSGLGSKLQLKIPRDRLGVFQPIILGLLNEQEAQVKDLCFELYGKGLTTRQIEDVIANIYGSSYSKSSVSRITNRFFIFGSSMATSRTGSLLSHCLYRCYSYQSSKRNSSYRSLLCASRTKRRSYQRSIRDC